MIKVSEFTRSLNRQTEGERAECPPARLSNALLFESRATSQQTGNMFTPKRRMGLKGAEDIIRVRRVTKAVMDTFNVERWRDPFEKVAVYGAVDVCVTALVRQGETNESILIASALEAVQARKERERR